MSHNSENVRIFFSKNHGSSAKFLPKPMAQIVSDFVSKTLKNQKFKKINDFESLIFGKKKVDLIFFSFVI